MKEAMKASAENATAGSPSPASPELRGGRGGGGGDGGGGGVNSRYRPTPHVARNQFGFITLSPSGAGRSPGSGGVDEDLDSIDDHDPRDLNAPPPGSCALARRNAADFEGAQQETRARMGSADYKLNSRRRQVGDFSATEAPPVDFRPGLPNAAASSYRLTKASSPCNSRRAYSSSTSGSANQRRLLLGTGPVPL